MSKVAGIHNKSPETYPSAPGQSNILKTESSVGPGGIALNGSTYTSLLGGPGGGGPVSINVPANTKFVVMFSGVLGSVSPGTTTVQLFQDTIPTVPAFTIQVETIGSSESTPFSFVWETPAPLAAGTWTFDVQGKGSSVAVDGSLVVIATSA